MKTAEEWIKEYKQDKGARNRSLAWHSGDLCRAIQHDAMMEAARIANELHCSPGGANALQVKQAITTAANKLKEGK